MRTLIVALFLARTAFASGVWFDPPNPTSRTAVAAHFTLVNGCPPKSVDVRRIGNTITIAVVSMEGCPPSSAPPFDVAADLGVLPAGLYDVVVGRDNLLIGIAAQLVVQDAIPELIVSPNVSQYGNEAVIVKGAGIAPICAVAPCPTPVVMFGDAKAPPVEVIDTNTVSVYVPRHDRGVVDVTVTNVGKTWRAAAAFDYYGIDRLFDPAFFEPVLFPVIINGPGAFGSQWSTDAVMRNDNDYRFPVDSIFNSNIFAVPPPENRVPAHWTSHLVGYAENPDGYLLWVPRQSARRTSFSLVVKDLSRQAEALGTLIPIVHEGEFLGRPFTILNVPIDSRYRVALRLYRIDRGTTMRIRIVGLDARDSSTPFVNDTIVLSTAQTGTHTFAAIGDLATRYPELAGQGPLRMEIDAESPQTAAWALVSVTNNQTQHVTVIAPQ